MTPPLEKRLGLELLRFYLAFAVVLYHYLCIGPVHKIIHPPYGNAPDSDLFWIGMLLGALAVPAFFVISGYTIFFSAERNKWRNFSAARVSRLYPALIVCATCTFLLQPVPQGQLASEYTRMYLDAVLFVPIYFERGMIDASYWSLAYEVRFYLFVAILLALRLFKHVSLVIIVVSLLGTAMSLSPEGVDLSKYFLFPYASFFGIGISIAQIERQGATIPNVLIAALHLGTASYGFLYGYEFIDMLDGVRSPWWVGLGAALFCTGVVIVHLRAKPSAKMARLAIPLGAISYPLYLFHQEIGYELIKYLAPHLGFWASTILAIFVALIAAWLVNIAIERPFSRPLRKLLSTNRKRDHEQSTTDLATEAVRPR